MNLGIPGSQGCSEACFRWNCVQWPAQFRACIAHGTGTWTELARQNFRSGIDPAANGHSGRFVPGLSVEQLKKVSLLRRDSYSNKDSKKEQNACRPMDGRFFDISFAGNEGNFLRDAGKTTKWLMPLPVMRRIVSGNAASGG